MGSYFLTIREVRRISAGGMPRPIHRDRRRRVYRLSARELGWKATPEVLRLLTKGEAK